MANRELARRRGRMAGAALLVTLVGGVTAVWGTQILLQVWPLDTPEAPADCREGVAGLLRAVARARTEAARGEGERGALRAFREALKPEWELRRGLSHGCADDPAALEDLALLDRLRYAEERAVRGEAAGLAALRRVAASRLGGR